MAKLIILLTALVVALHALVAALSAQQLPPAKQAIEQQYAQEQATGSRNPAPKNPSAAYPIVPQQPFETGILDDCSPPFAADVLTITSCWQGIVNNNETEVYAGAQTANPQQGVVIVLTESGTGQSVATTVQAGAVQIVAVQNNVLTLVSASGSYVMSFDIGSGTFTSSVIVPASQISPTQLMVSTSGLAYSRASQMYSGTMTVKNIGTTSIVGPIQIVFTSLSAGVTLENQTGVFNGSPYLTIPTVASLTAGQTTTFTIQFQDPSNTTIHFTPVAYSGSFNK